MPPAMSAINTQQVVKEYDAWLRLAIMLHSCLKEVLLDVMHDPNYLGLPRDPKTLNTEFRNQQPKIKQLTPKILKKDQVDHLLPKNSQETDSQNFDVTLICVLIINFTNLPAPIGSWKIKTPKTTDSSIAAWVIRARNWRNGVLHYGEPKTIDTNEFNSLWKEGENILHGLGYINNAKTQKLKTISLDPNSQLIAKPLDDLINKLIKKIAENKTNINENTANIFDNKASIAKLSDQFRSISCVNLVEELEQQERKLDKRLLNIANRQDVCEALIKNYLPSTKKDYNENVDKVTTPGKI